MQQEKAKQELECKRKEEEDTVRRAKEEKHQAMLAQREVYREKAKNILIFADEPEPVKIPKGRKKKDVDESIYSSGDASTDPDKDGKMLIEHDTDHAMQCGCFRDVKLF